MQTRLTESCSAFSLEKAAQTPWRTFRGVLFDWAGTTIDFGSLAPVEVVREVFKEIGIEVSESEARAPMGKAKIDHLREVMQFPAVESQWIAKRETVASEEDLLGIYARFLSLQKSVLAKYSQLIPGVIGFVEFLRTKGIRIGSTTGYTRELMEVLLPLAAQAGYSPDTTVCSDEVAAGRPAPWSNFHAAERIGVYPMKEILVVDDSIAGIQAGKNAGCFAVAVTTTGNAFGMSLRTLNEMDPVFKKHHQQRVEREFYDAGADLVVESIGVLHELWQQFQQGKQT